MAATKDSLDRFGDDMLRQLLSGLSFKQRYRYESVCKQWQRLVFTDARPLVIHPDTQLIINLSRKSDYEVRQAVRVMATKYPIVNTIVIHSNHPVIQPLMTAIVNHWPDLAAIHLDIHYDTEMMDQLCRKLAKRLKKLSFKRPLNASIDNALNESVKRLSYLVALNADRMNETPTIGHVFTDSGQTGGLIVAHPALKYFRFHYSSVDLPQLLLFTDIYGQRVCRLDIELNIGCNYEAIQALLVYALPQMKQLVEFALDVKQLADPLVPSVLDELPKVGMGCVRLKSLLFVMGFGRPQETTRLTAIIVNYFGHLKRLHISADFDSSSAASLTRCGRLTHLSLNSYRYKLDDHFFDCFAICLPRLQSLRLALDTKITFVSLNQLADLKHIRSLILSVSPSMVWITRDYIINCCPKIVSIDIKSNFDDNEDTDIW